MPSLTRLLNVTCTLVTHPWSVLFIHACEASWLSWNLLHRNPSLEGRWNSVFFSLLYLFTQTINYIVWSIKFCCVFLLESTRLIFFFEKETEVTFDMWLQVSTRHFSRQSWLSLGPWKRWLRRYVTWLACLMDLHFQKFNAGFLPKSMHWTVADLLLKKCSIGAPKDL